MPHKKNKKRTRWRQSVQDFLVSETFSPEIHAEVSELFNKKFKYQHSDNFNLPQSNKIFTSSLWEDDYLQGLKTSLNETKSRLSDLDITEWHKHTQQMNKAGDVLNKMKELIRVELCTQAWCKFYEIINSYPIIHGFDDRAAMFSSLHICEAPGAFITSLNHYLCLSAFQGQWKWLGNTLNPYNESNSLDFMVTDDRFIYPTYPQWYFGVDNTGDIMLQDNLLDLKQKAVETEKFNLVTADGSIDCANSPAEQEIITSSLHYCELITALHVLDIGGSLVIKMFTLYEHTSVCLMYLINCVFSEVSVCKPATSKSGNSEVYVVALGYKGIDEDTLTALTKPFGPNKPTMAMFSHDDIPQSFMDQHMECCRKFYTYQVQTITTNLSLYGNCDSEINKSLVSARNCCTQEYIRRFNLQPILPQQKIVPPNNKCCRPNPRFLSPCAAHGGQRHRGSYLQRQQLLNLPWHSKVTKINKIYLSQEEQQISWLQNGDYNMELHEWQPVFGKALSVVNNSKLCDASLLELYNEIMTKAKFSNGSQCLNIDGNRGKELFNSAIVDNDRATVHVLHDYPDSMRLSESLLHQCSLGKLAETLKSCSSGDSVILTLPPPLTRYNAGLILLLQYAFNKVSLISSADLPFVHLIAIQSQPVQTSSVQLWLESLSEKLQNQNAALLELVPIYLLFDEAFFSYIYKANNIFLKRRINYMIDLEKKGLNITADTPS